MQSVATSSPPMATPQEFLTTAASLAGSAASLAGSAVVICTVAKRLVPNSVQFYLSSTLAGLLARFFSTLAGLLARFSSTLAGLLARFSSTLAGLLARFSSRLTVVVNELDDITVNQMYKAAQIYLGTNQSPSTRRLRVVKQDDSAGLDVTMERGEEIVDVFQQVKFRWRLLSGEVRYLEVTFHKRHKDFLSTSYLPYVLEQSKAIRKQSKTLKLYTNKNEMWTPVNIHHPATFETLAMEEQRKKELMDDLERFERRKEFYKRRGKAWKRGYLLYGPPGTGKSSLIAAMANFLRSDVFDLELTQVRDRCSLGWPTGRFWWWRTSTAGSSCRAERQRRGQARRRCLPMMKRTR